MLQIDPSSFLKYSICSVITTFFVIALAGLLTINSICRSSFLCSEPGYHVFDILHMFDRRKRCVFSSYFKEDEVIICRHCSTHLEQALFFVCSVRFHKMSRHPPLERGCFGALNLEHQPVASLRTAARDVLVAEQSSGRTGLAPLFRFIPFAHCL